MRQQPDTIYFNGRFLNQPQTGVQRYCSELMRATDWLCERREIDADGFNLVCLAPSGVQSDPHWKRIELRPVGKFQGNLWEQFDLPLHAADGRLFSPANIGPYISSDQVVTIHDASVYAVPQAYSLTFRLKYRTMLRRLGKIARRVITVSEFSKSELVRYCHIDPLKISVIPHGSDHLANIQPDASILERYNLSDRRYLLTVGSDSPHKNYIGLAKALTMMKTNDFDVIVVGGTFERIFQDNKVNWPENVKKVGFVNDHELRALYEHAAGFVFPSKYEGFGMPVLEAMAFGCPVICSNAASLPEVGGDAVLYFDPNDPEEIAGQIERLLTDHGLQEILRAKGLARAANFTWEATAKETWKLLCEDLTG